METCHAHCQGLGKIPKVHLSLLKYSCVVFPRGAEILFSLAVAHARHTGMEGRYPTSDYTLLTDARRTVALFQHHDAITGTAKENVVIDYGNRSVAKRDTE